MIFLINKLDIAQYKQISDNVPDKVYKPYINDAQFHDLQKLLGGNFYNDLIRNYTDAKYSKLLNGGDYEYSGTTYTNVGLKSVLVHFAYARYILLGSNIDTPFGFVTKTNDNSSAVDYSTKKIIHKENQNLAFNYWENVLNFLIRNSTDYPLFKNGCVQGKRGFRISKIG